MDDEKLPIEALPNTNRLAKLLYDTLEEQMQVFLKTGDRLTFTLLLNAFSFDLEAYHENFDHWLAAKMPQYYRELREFDETLIKADALLSEATRLVAH